MRKVDYDAKYDRELNTWVKKSEGSFIIGIISWSQAIVGNLLVISEVPEEKSTIPKESVLCILESDKTSTEICSPLGRTVESINHKVLSNPSMINEDCYHEGWIVKIICTQPFHFESLFGKC